MTSPTAAAIAAANQRLMETFAAGDAAGVASLYTAGGQLMPANSGIIEGPAAIAEFWGGAMGMGIAAVKLTTLELDDLGDTAIEVGSYQLAAEGDMPLDRGTYIVVWKNDGGSWKLHRDMWTTDLPPAE